MPIFDVELDDGRILEIEARDSGEAAARATEYARQESMMTVDVFEGVQSQQARGSTYENPHPYRPEAQGPQVGDGYSPPQYPPQRGEYVTGPDGRVSQNNQGGYYVPRENLEPDGSGTMGAIRAVSNFTNPADILYNLAGFDRLQGDYWDKVRRSRDRQDAGTLGAMSGLTFGFADELAGMVGGDAARDDMRAAQERAGRDFPASYGAGQIGGGVVSTLPMAPMALGARGAVAMGGLAGGLQGAGDARGGVIDRATGAAQGAALGAGLGGGGYLAAQGIGSAGGALMSGARRLLPGTQAPAAAARGGDRMIANALRRDGITPEGAATEIQRWNAMNVPPDVLNVGGENTRAMLRAAASRPGPARNLATEYAANVRASEPGRAADNAAALSEWQGNADELRSAIENARRSQQQQIAGTLPNTRLDLSSTMLGALQDPSYSAVGRDTAATLRMRGRLGDPVAELDATDLARAMRRPEADSGGGAPVYGMGQELRQIGGSEVEDAQALWMTRNRPVDPGGNEAAPNVLGIIRRMGGINDRDGDIASILADERTRQALPGLSRSGGVAPIPGLTNQNGRSFEDVVEALREAGALGPEAQARNSWAMNAQQGSDAYLDDRQRALEVIRDAIANPGLRRASSTQDAIAADAEQYANRMGIDVSGSLDEALEGGRMLALERSMGGAGGSPTPVYGADYIPNEADLPPALSPRGYMALNQSMLDREGAMLAGSSPNTAGAAALAELRNRTMNPVRAQIPGVNAMLMAGESAGRQRDALGIGARAVTARGTEDFRGALNAFSSSRPSRLDALGQEELERNAMAAGARNSLQSNLMEGRFGNLINDSGVVERLRTVSPDRAEPVINALRSRQARAQQANFIAPNTGSQTQLRQADADGLVNEWLQSTPLSASGVLAMTLRTLVRGGATMTDEEAAQIVRRGIAQASPEDIAEIMARGSAFEDFLSRTIKPELAQAVMATVREAAPRAVGVGSGQAASSAINGN
jgi:hypothetical protein